MSDDIWRRDVGGVLAIYWLVAARFPSFEDCPSNDFYVTLERPHAVRKALIQIVRERFILFTSIASGV